MNTGVESDTVFSMDGRSVPQGYDAFIVDVDGVLTRGSQPLPGAVDAVKRLQAAGHVVLLTNNSTRSCSDLSDHLESLGFAVPPADVLASSRLAARHLFDLGGETRVWVIGEAGLRSELATAGHRLVERPHDADWIVVGMDRALNYEKLTSALQALLGGARLLATNEDATYPTTRRLVPGAGAVVGALRGMGYAPELVIGKPSTLAFDLALRELGVPKRRVLMIGDRLETDIAGANRVGLDAALVLTGVSSVADIERVGIRPAWVADDLAGIACGRAKRFSKH